MDLVTTHIKKVDTRKWCNKKDHTINIGSRHDLFIQETDELFEIILNRIQDETEKLYPMVRDIRKVS